jgi:hypothetical protein
MPERLGTIAKRTATKDSTMFNKLKRISNRHKYRDVQDDPTQGGGGTGSGGNEPPNPNSADPNSQAPLSDEAAKLMKEVMKKKEALQAAENEKKALAERLAQFEGVDPDEYKKLVGEKKAQELQELERRGEFERIREQMAKQHEEEVKALREQLNSVSGETDSKLKEYETRITELTIGRAFGDSTFIKDELVGALTPAKVRALFGAQFEVKDGQVVAYDKPAGAKDRTILVDASGAPLSFDAAIRKIIDTDPDRDSMLKSKLKPGAGSNNDSDGRPPAPRVAAGADRIKAALAGGALKFPTPR